MLHFKDEITHNLENTVITLGNFDGVHLGHQKLINEAKEYSKLKGCRLLVLTFTPHPLTILKGIAIKNILTSDEKTEVLKEMGVDIFVEYNFTKDIMNLSPENFIKEILIKKLGAKAIFVGSDFRFGKDRIGNIKTIESVGKLQDVQVINVSLLFAQNEKISSSDIRKLIEIGNFLEVEKACNRKYFIKSQIVVGKKLGRTIGFPTVNILPDKNKLIPNFGVYLTQIEIEGKLYNGITNVGDNPTVNDNYTVIETYIYDFNKDVYGQTVKLFFCKKIREQVKFNSLDELKIQISKDYNSGVEYFSNKNNFFTKTK